MARAARRAGTDRLRRPARVRLSSRRSGRGHAPRQQGGDTAQAQASPGARARKRGASAPGRGSARPRGAARSGHDGRANEKRGRCCHRPCSVPAESCDSGRFPIESNEASSEGLNPGSVKASFDRSLSQPLRPKAPVRRTPEEVGSASACASASRFSSGCPTTAFSTSVPEGLPPLPRWRHSEAFVPKDGGS